MVIINFLIIALVIFLLIRTMEWFIGRREEEAAIDPVLESQQWLVGAMRG